METQKKTFADLKPREDFIYEIKKNSTDAFLLKWRLTGIGNFGRPSENYYEFEVEEPNAKRPDSVILVHVNSFKKSSYRNTYFSDRDEAVAAYRLMIERFAARANEEVIRLSKQMAVAQAVADKFSARLLKIV